MYFIKRDSDNMWLMGYKYGLNSSGRPTSIWGDDVRDAISFTSAEQAREVAAVITGCTLIYKRAKGAM